MARYGSQGADVLAGAEPAGADTPVRGDSSGSPQTTEGPYYIHHGDGSGFSKDITEGRPGVPLHLRITVLGPDTAPVEGAVVDLWHCDALGYYSGHLAHDPDTFPDVDESGHVPPSDDSRFLRGCQPTAANGAAEFTTIYPGWYFTRSIHIHLKATVDGQERYTGQVYLPEEYNEAVAGFAPYNQHTTLERLRNEDDLVYQLAGGPDLLLIVAPVVLGNVEAGLNASFTLTLAPPRRRDRPPTRRHSGAPHTGQPDRSP
jgi:protocatechuate 3,4-dioxygenase beta subunit